MGKKLKQFRRIADNLFMKIPKMLLLAILCQYGCSGVPVAGRGPASEKTLTRDINGLREEFVKLNKRAKKISQQNKVNVSPFYIRDYIARRFINRPDWEKYLNENKKSGKEINEKEVYKPVPVTWDNWLLTAREIEERAKEERDLEINEFMQWNIISVQGTTPGSIKLGKLKNNSNYGANTKQRDALTKEEIKAINKINLNFLSPWIQNKEEKKLVSEFSLKWTSLVCEESLPKSLDLFKGNEACKKLYNNVKFKNMFTVNKSAGLSDKAKMESGILTSQESLHAWYWYQCWPRLSEEEVASKSLQCGMITYLDPKYTKKALKLLVNGINGFLSTPHSPEESFDFAIKVQRAFVAIHPINKGNGRLSRWLMDYITYKSGLPPLLVFDHNRDLSTSEEKYQSLIANETRKGLQKISECLKKWEQNPHSIQEADQTECGMIDH